MSANITKDTIMYGIICHKHGPFDVNAFEHLQGKGCPKCEIPIVLKESDLQRLSGTSCRSDTISNGTRFYINSWVECIFLRSILTNLGHSFVESDDSEGENGEFVIDTSYPWKH